jgi:hypothetical protein
MSLTNIELYQLECHVLLCLRIPKTRIWIPLTIFSAKCKFKKIHSKQLTEWNFIINNLGNNDTWLLSKMLCEKSHFLQNGSLNNIKVSCNPCVKMLMDDSENVTTVTWTVPVQKQWIKFGTGKWLVWSTTHYVQILSVQLVIYRIGKVWFQLRISFIFPHITHSILCVCVCVCLLFLLQSNLGLRVTWFVSVLQDKQKMLINCNLIYERGLAIRVVCICCFVFVCRASRDHYWAYGSSLTSSVSVSVPHLYSQHPCERILFTIVL